VHALAHITGGGIPGNLPRVLPAGLGAVIRRASWQPPAVFRALQQAGGVDEGEMDRVFNMGVGMIAIVPPADADAVARELVQAGEIAWRIGEVERGEGVRYA
jgi:phosphoribosylformylglycinamidine cyclo-ligase